MREARELFANDEDVVVPRVHERCSTGRVLAAELLDGEHLARFLAGDPDAAARDRRGEQILRANLRRSPSGRLPRHDLLHQLGARVDMARVNAEETARAGR